MLIISQHFPPDKSANASRTQEMSCNLGKFGMNNMVFTTYPSFPPSTFKRIWKLRQTQIIDDNHIFNLWSWQPRSTDPGFLSRMLYYLTFPLHACLWCFFYTKKYDVIITSSPPIFTAIPGLVSKVFLKKKWIIDSRDSWIDASIAFGFLKKGRLLEKISRNFDKTCYKKSDLVGATTKVLADRLYQIYNFESDKLVLIPNGADTDIFYPRNVPKKKQIIFLGNIGYAQDLEKYILAMKKVSEKHDIKLLIVGGGDTKNELEKLVQTENLGNIVIFKGLIPREKVPEILSESIIGIAPMKKLETLKYMAPVKVYEYMACELPFLASGMGEVVKLAEESEAGIITEDSPEFIANTIINLLDNPDKLNKMGKKGRAYIKENYDRKDIMFKLKLDIDNLIEVPNEKNGYKGLFSLSKLSK